jgi:hypothetical protein
MKENTEKRKQAQLNFTYQVGTARPPTTFRFDDRAHSSNDSESFASAQQRRQHGLLR